MFNASVLRRVNITDELVIFHVKPDSGVANFEPGQYVAIGLPGSSPRPAHFPPEKEVAAPDKIIKRAYSIGSSPAQKEYLEFYIAIVPDGALTSRLMLAQEGDRIWVAAKITGTFTAHDVPADKNLVLVSTGTGIAPFLAMVRHESIWSPGRKITILHGVRFDRDLAYRDELMALAAENENFRYAGIVSRQSPGWEGPRGHVQSMFTDNTIKLDPEKDHVFLCGNPAMIDDMEKLLGENGYKEHTRKSPGNLHLERYW